jgi:hypothetical protein
VAGRGVARLGKAEHGRHDTSSKQTRGYGRNPAFCSIQAAKGEIHMAFAKKTEGVAVIVPANIVSTVIKIVGTAPFVQNKFSQKSKEKMMGDMATKSVDKKAKSARPPRNYDDDFIACQHKSVAGWNGIPAAALRAAMIDACRTVNLPMTKAKMSVFVVPDGFDEEDGTPLVRLHSDTPPERSEQHVRNDNGGADIRIRAMWRKWSADVPLEFDADMISGDSVINLLDRAGRQVGIGEGRPFSKSSVGQGWGTFTVEGGK